MFNYYIMDGRARFNIDRAIVISVCASLKEAKQEMREEYQEYDYVVVDGNDNIVFDPMANKSKKKNK